MSDKNELLKKAFLRAVQTLPPASVDDNIEEDVFKTEMKAFAQREGVEFTDDEIHETIVSGLKEIKEASDYSKFNSISSASHAACSDKNELLKKAFFQAADQLPPASIDDDIEVDVFVNSMKAFAQNEGIEFTDEEIHETIVSGLKEINKASDDFKY